jgi:predicted site-specific integrase-resolvase
MRIGFKTKQQVADEFSISYSTLYRYLKKGEIKVSKNKLLSPLEYKIIYEYLANLLSIDKPKK